VRRGLLDAVTGGVEADRREALHVGERELRELRELVDGSLVGRGQLVDLEHVGPWVG
jgi:hypothetical protein